MRHWFPNCPSISSNFDKDLALVRSNKFFVRSQTWSGRLFPAYSEVIIILLLQASLGLIIGISVVLVNVVKAAAILCHFFRSEAKLADVNLTFIAYSYSILRTNMLSLFRVLLRARFYFLVLPDLTSDCRNHFAWIVLHRWDRWSFGQIRQITVGLDKNLTVEVLHILILRHFLVENLCRSRRHLISVNMLKFFVKLPAIIEFCHDLISHFSTFT